MAADANPAPRLRSLRGVVAVLFDISKPRGIDFLDRVEMVLRQTYHVKEVIRARKRTFTKPAPRDLLVDLARQADCVILGVADCGSCNTCVEYEARSAAAHGQDTLHTCGLSACAEEALFFEKHGIPTTVVATVEYAQAVRAQSTEFGSRRCPMVTVRRSIQRLVRDQVWELADETIDTVVQHLTETHPAPATARSAPSR